MHNIRDHRNLLSIIMKISSNILPSFFCSLKKHSNKGNFLARFVEKMCFGVQTQTKLVTL